MMIRFIFSLLFLTLTLNSAQAQVPAQKAGVKAVDETCRLLGTVIKTEQWLYAPYNNAPSAFSDIYTRLTLEIQAVGSFERYSEGEASYCDQVQQMPQQSFKLCAPVEPKLGDVIEGVIAPSVGLTEDGCLFDVKITDNVRNKTAEETAE